MALQSEHSILFVDDEKSIANALRRLFRKEGYQLFTASSGQEALDLLSQTEKPVSLIISDQRMPEMNGAQFLERARKIFPDAMRFLLTGYSDMDAIVDAVNNGKIHRYLTKPWNDDDLVLQVRQALEQVEMGAENKRLQALTAKQNKELKILAKGLEKKVQIRTREIALRNKALKSANQMLEKSFHDVIRLLVSLVESLNPKLGAYMRQTADISTTIAHALKLEKKEIDQIKMAALIHDIGLMGLPEEMLGMHEGELSDDQLRMYRQHPVIASMWLESMENLSSVGEMVLFHHEYVDGSGFPSRIKGADIPLGSRIIQASSLYSRIHTAWPREVNRLKTFVGHTLGQVAGEINWGDPDVMMRQIAERMLLFGIGKQYDEDIVNHLIRIVNQPDEIAAVKEQDADAIVRVGIEELKEGMKLVTDLRLIDGRLLLAKHSELSSKSIETLQNLARNSLIESEIYITR